MTVASQNRTEIKPVEIIREYRREKTALFGLIQWSVVERVESIGTELRIACQKTPEKVFLNGIEYKPVK